MDPREIADLVVATLGAYRYRYRDEPHLHVLIVQALDNAGVTYKREVWLSEPARTERIDLMCGTVGIEVKVQGQPAQVLRQLGRYAATGKLDVLVLASTKKRLLAAVPPDVHGVPVVPVFLKGPSL